MNGWNLFLLREGEIQLVTPVLVVLYRIRPKTLPLATILLGTHG